MRNRKKLTKFKKVALPLSIGVILAVVPFIYLQTKKAPEAKAGWFDENWLYRQEVTIPNSGSEATNEAVSIPIDTKALISAGKMLPSCNDVRFTTATGQVLKHDYKPNPIKITNVTSTKSEANTNTISLTHRVDSGVNNALVVVYHGMNTSVGGNTFDITNATFNGDTMTERIEVDSNSPIERDFATSIWTLANPDVGSYTVTITLGENVDSHILAAYTLSGVDQNIVAGTTASNTANPGTSLSVTGSTTYAESLIVGGVLRRQNANFDVERITISDGIQAYWEENSLANTEIAAAGVYKTTTTAGSYTITADNNGGSERLNGAWVEIVQNSPSDAYGCNTTNAVDDTIFDVYLPKIRAGGEKIYMYYGNSRVTSNVTKLVDSTQIDEVSTTPYESTTTTNSYSYTHTVTAGDNQMLVVMVHGGNRQSPDSSDYFYVDTLTFNGDPLFLQERIETYITGENLLTEMWVLPNPDVVTNGTVAITFDKTIDRLVSAAITLDDVKQDLFSSITEENSTTSGSSLTVTATPVITGSVLVGGGTIEYATGSLMTVTSNDAGDASDLYGATEETGTDNTVDIQGAGDLSYVATSLQFTPTSGTTHHINAVAAILNPTTFKYFTPTSSITTSEEKTTGPSGFWKFDEGVNDTCTGGTADACDTTNNANDAVSSDLTMWQDAKYCITDSCFYFDGLSKVAPVYQHATPVASWQFEEQLGLKASDSSGNEYSLTLSNSSWTASGKWNGAWDGTAAVWMTHPDDASFDFSTGSSFTLAGWFKRSATSTQEYILAKEEPTGADGGYRVSMESDGDILCGVDTDNSGFPLDSVTSTAATYDDGNWHHFACIKNASTSMTLYIDGTLVSTDSSLTGVGTYANDDALVIGDHTGVDGGNEFAGDLDDIRIYTSALTAGQLAALYNTGLAQSNAIDFDKNLAAGSTIETWFKVISDGENSTGEIYDKGTNTYARVTNEGSDNLGDLEVSMDLATDATFTLVNAVTFNKWHHLAVTYTDDGDDEITVYLDGKSIGSSTNGVGAPATDTNDLLIGGDTSNNFHGYIDEFKIYAYERSPAEVKTDFLKNSSKSGSGTATGYKNQDFLNQNLAGYWTFDEVDYASSDAADYSGNPNNLSDTTIPGIATVSGKISNAADFNGSSEYMFAFDGTDLSITSSLTMSAWINPDTVTGSQTIAGKWDGSNESYLLSLNGSAVRFSVDSASNYAETASSVVTTGSYQHIVAVYNSSNQTVKIYVNGNEQSVTVTGTIPSSIADDAGKFSAGAEDSSGTPANYYNGKLDDLRLYSRALSLNEVKDLFMWTTSTTTYSAKEDLVARWKFDEGRLNSCSGGTNDFCDSTSNANDLLFSTTSGGYTSSGRFGHAFDGDGSVRASRADDADFDFTATDSFTITGWFKRGDAGQEYILAKEETTGADGGYRVSMESDGDISCGVDTDNSGFPLDSVTSTAASYEDDTWHHFACVKNSSINMLLYIDGVQVAADISLTSAGTYANDDTLYIADYDSSDNGNEFTGDLDDIHIYNIALSQTQIANDYNALAAINVGVTGDSETYSYDIASANLKGYWKMDENTGSTLYDISANANNSTSVANVTWVNGVKGSALSFNGTSSNVTWTDDADFDFGTGSFAISVWVKHNGTIATNNDYIVSKADGTNGGYKIYMDTNGALCFGIDDDGTSFPEDSACTTTTGFNVDFDDSKWHHIVAQKNGTSGIYLYVNGLLLASDVTLSATNTISNGGSLYLGVDSDGTSNEWDGAIDDAKVVNTTLTNYQIANLFKEDDPLAWWRMDECTDSTIYDVGPFAMNGTLTLGGSGTTSAGNCVTSATSSWYNGRSGAINSGLDFDGTDDYVTVADESTYDTLLTEALDFPASADFSITGWFYRDTATTDDVILAKRNGVAAGDVGYIIYINDDADGIGGTDDDLLTFEASDGVDEYSVISSAAYISTGWNHFAFVWDDDSEAETKLYINGVYDADATAPETLSAVDSLSNSVTLRLGSESDGANYFDGKLDDIRIFPYPLSATQVKKIFNNGGASF